MYRLIINDPISRPVVARKKRLIRWKQHALYASPKRKYETDMSHVNQLSGEDLCFRNAINTITNTNCFILGFMATGKLFIEINST